MLWQALNTVLVYRDVVQCYFDVKRSGNACGTASNVVITEILDHGKKKKTSQTSSGKEETSTITGLLKL